MNTKAYLLLILSLPNDNATARMRAWRALKACGAGVLRDGAYLLPETEAQRERLEAIAADVRAHAGSAHLIQVDGAAHADWPALFDRSGDWAALLAELHGLRAQLQPGSALETLKQLRKLAKALSQLQAIDYFPGPAQQQALSTFSSLEQDAHAALSPSEPRARPATAILRLRVEDYQGRLWATRARPWVDRLACAWLIRRFIDTRAQLLWLKHPKDCPKRALGFDFDGAMFGHVGERVSFETLLAAFGLETPALLRLGRLVHGLDAGGVQAPEAAGVEQILGGMFTAITDDDQLLVAAAGIFEGLWRSFEVEASGGAATKPQP
ncbi:chromate resistance protein [Paucibacter sp. APW11]|uniref:Chromate resistance protein n=1 Tax=Roseateles aquae TaxID=3077235 RepID=A0ABU3PFT7_9BURK|nr:chromate resistance protein ChrB domain-containing protein [Paucibacter sp. APW11]MDT9001459.1 chromate resistance protein [Paucibacter sp. APW11]